MDTANIFKDIVSTEEGMHFLNLMRERRFLLKDTSISPRNYNQWQNSGLLDMPDESDSRKRIKLNMVEYVWLYIVRDLRTFGLPFPDIINLKKKILADTSPVGKIGVPEETLMKTLLDFLQDQYSLTPSEAEQKLKDEMKEKKVNTLHDLLHSFFGRGLTYLELFLMQKGILNKDSSLIVYLDYLTVDEKKVLEDNSESTIEPTPVLDCHIYSEVYDERANSTQEKERLFGKPHIHLPISHYVKTFVKFQLSKSKEIGWLSENEFKVIKLVREGKVDSITIKLQNGIPHLLNATTNHVGEIENELINNFTRQAYVDVSYSVEGGKVQSFKLTEKTILR